MTDQSIKEPISVHPWRRYLARATDDAITGKLLYMALMFMFPAQLALSVKVEKEITIIFLFLGFILLLGFFSILSNSVLMTLTGTTLGKWLFGIKVRDEDDKRLSFTTLLKREYLVLKEGKAFGLPLVNFFTLFNSRSRLKRLGYTNWDLQSRTKVLYRKQGLLQGLLSFLGLILFIFI